MKTTLTYSSLDAQAPWPALLTQQLEHWHTLTTVTGAEVVLQYRQHDTNAFRVKVRLDVPGPGFHTEASGSTLEGALLMATRDLERQIQARNAKPAARDKRAPHPSVRSRRRASGRA